MRRAPFTVIWNRIYYCDLYERLLSEENLQLASFSFFDGSVHTGNTKYNECNRPALNTELLKHNVRGLSEVVTESGVCFWGCSLVGLFSTFPVRNLITLHKVVTSGPLVQSNYQSNAGVDRLVQNWKYLKNYWMRWHEFCTCIHCSQRVNPTSPDFSFPPQNISTCNCLIGKKFGSDIQFNFIISCQCPTRLH